MYRQNPISCATYIKKEDNIAINMVSIAITTVQDVIAGTILPQPQSLNISIYMELPQVHRITRSWQKYYKSSAMAITESSISNRLD
jgi:hypothetical protein